MRSLVQVQSPRPLYLDRHITRLEITSRTTYPAVSCGPVWEPSQPLGTYNDPAKGNEKRSVENLVGYVRRNALVPIRDYASYEGLNDHLLGWSEKERNRLWDSWLKEREGLRPLPERSYPCFITKLAVVSKTSLVTFDRNRYSVPSKWVSRTVQVIATWDRVKVAAGEEVVAEHERRYGRGETVVELEHYLSTPAVKTLDSFDFTAVPDLPKPKVLALAQGDSP